MSEKVQVGQQGGKKFSTESLIKHCNKLPRVLVPSHIQESFGQQSQISGLTVRLFCVQSDIELDDPSGSLSAQDLFYNSICNSKCYAFLYAVKQYSWKNNAVNYSDPPLFQEGKKFEKRSFVHTCACSSWELPSFVCNLKHFFRVQICCMFSLERWHNFQLRGGLYFVVCLLLLIC